MKIRCPKCIWLVVLLGSTVVFGQQSGDPQTYRLTLPESNWSLDVSLKGFIVTMEEIKASGSVYNFNAGQFPEKKTSSPRRANLRIHMEPAQLKGSAADLRVFAMKMKAKNKAVDKGSLKALEYGQIPLIRYNVPIPDLLNMYSSTPDLLNRNRGPSQTKSLEAFFVKDDVWIMVGVEVDPFKEDDEQLFYSILDSVKIIDNAAPSSSFDYYQKGRSLFLQGKHREGVEPLSEALKLEQAKAQLGKSEWRELVYNLANAYGAVGNKSAFDEVLEYGINHDPTYYRFHFTRARMHASEGKLDETIASLEKAFLYQQSEPPLIRIFDALPDPLYDPAFERFRKDDKFRKAVKAMKR
jgi:tetratricopeptide (TPR) repeat protein